MKIATPSGPALVDLDEPDAPAFLLVMTHGANAGVATPDLLAVRAAGRELGGAVARVLQPFRLAGRRAPGPEARQDEAWLTVVAALRERYGDLPLVQGGRSNGARVACRTARKASARGVIALAFPLHPPGRPERSRAGELYQAGVEVLVVNGDRDPFGVPDPAPGVQVCVLPGVGHDLGRDPAQVGGWWPAGSADGRPCPGEHPGQSGGRLRPAGRRRPPRRCRVGSGGEADDHFAHARQADRFGRAL